MQGSALGKVRRGALTARPSRFARYSGSGAWQQSRLQPWQRLLCRARRHPPSVLRRAPRLVVKVRDDVEKYVILMETAVVEPQEKMTSMASTARSSVSGSGREVAIDGKVNGNVVAVTVKSPMVAKAETEEAARVADHRPSGTERRASRTIW